MESYPQHYTLWMDMKGKSFWVMKMVGILHQVQLNIGSLSLLFIRVSTQSFILNLLEWSNSAG